MYIFAVIILVIIVPDLVFFNGNVVPNVDVVVPKAGAATFLNGCECKLLVNAL